MVIYHGKQDWKLGNALDTMIQDYDELSDDVKKGIPNFSYHVYDLNRFSDEEIINGSLYYVATSIMKHVNRQDPQALFEALKRVAKALNGMNEKETAMEYFETCLRYVYEIVPEFSYDNANMLQKYVEQIFPEGSEVAMTLAEVLREEGVAKGEIKTLIKMAIKLLTQKFGVMPAEYSEAITKLDSTNLEILIDGIKGFEDLDDVKKFLAL